MDAQEMTSNRSSMADEGQRNRKPETEENNEIDLASTVLVRVRLAMRFNGECCNHSAYPMGCLCSQRHTQHLFYRVDSSLISPLCYSTSPAFDVPGPANRLGTTRYRRGLNWI
jgi:hypothetical protein